jgi:ATP-dependent Clp protease ATP-binding subunit ClpC
MPKINVYLPDELAEAVKEAGVPVSAVCQRALQQAVRRITAIRELTLSNLDSDAATGPTRFTTRVKDAIRLGGEAARERGASEIGTEHLLIGLLREGGNLAVRLLPTLEIDPAEVERQLAALPAASGGQGAGQLNAQAAGALELAVTEAVGMGHNYVGGEHLLLGLIAEPDGAAGRVLRGLGAELRLTRRSINAAVAAYAHQQATTAPGATMLAQAVRSLTERLDRLERRLDSGEGSTA